jgi:hypothetical protein
LAMRFQIKIWKFKVIVKAYIAFGKVS